MPAINMTRFKQYLQHEAQQYLSFPLHDSRHPLVEPHYPVLDGVTEAVGRVGIFVLVHLNSRTPHASRRRRWPETDDRMGRGHHRHRKLAAGCQSATAPHRLRRILRFVGC